MRKLSILCVMLLAICLVSCDLLTGPKVDMYKEISDSVDWANAPKLAVRIEFPEKWGISSPAQGDITQTVDIRRGFEFSVEFTPDIMYSLQSWKVFRTEDLKNLSSSASWVENPELINDPNYIQQLGPDEVTLRDFNASARVFKFIIYTTDPVTLVPCCDTEPRITRTEPRNRPDPPYPRASDITLYFNGALDVETVKFASSETDDGIWITALSDGNVTTNSTERWFSTPEYAATGGFFTVTMKTGANLPPAESVMTVRVSGIKNAQGNPMAESGYSFSWKTSRAVDVSFSSYSATYKDDENKITVTCAQTGADNVVTYYRLNKGANIDFTGSISNVPALNDSGVKEGGQITGMAEYEIFIELYVDEMMERRTSFKIWNFPGMIVSNTNRAIEVTDPEGLGNLNLNNATMQYVLANDITVNGEWTPIGGDGAPFKGKFYGAGHTITLNGGFIGEGDLGLFGYAKDATIRDLTIVYNAPEINVAASLDTPFEMYQANINGNPPPPNESNFSFDFKALRVGGLAGHLENSNVNNIITSGGTIKVKSKPCDGTVSLPLGENGAYEDFPDGGVLLGGIAGYVEGGKIENCRAALSTQFTPGSNATLVAITGAIAGVAVDGSIGKVTIAANVNADIIDFIGTVGGAVGVSQKNTLNDITFTSGTVTFSGNSTLSVCAGIVGMSSMITMERCSFLGNITVTTDAEVTVGGLVGNNETNSGKISNCRVQGNINVTCNGSPTVGGFLGVSKSRDSFTIENCSFNGGNITVTGTDNKRVDIGGFCGSIEGIPNPAINNCGVLSGTLTANVTGILRVGGFISYIVGSISGSFSRMDIVVNSSSTSSCNVGGFSGILASSESKIDKCFATGTVSLETVSTNTPEDNKNMFGLPSAGGLVGFCMGEITNSYALGNVVASDSGDYGPTYAGGLVGRIDTGSIKNCFSAGLVSAQSEKISAYCGGIVGSSKDKDIKNTAALGGSVTALSPPSGTVSNPAPDNHVSANYSRSVGRIIGNTISNASDNYALNTMLIEEDKFGVTAPDTRDANEDVDDNFDQTRDGQDTNSGVFFTQSFWSGTLGFLPANWDFSRVGKDGYPRLANVGGQQ